MSISNDLRQAVLQAAIQGKLTKQLPEDGDAKDLLERIKAEKTKLVKDGKLKKEKPLPEITEDEKPFDIPENWEWVRLGVVSTYGNVKKKINVKEALDNTWLLDLEDIEKGGALLQKKTVVESSARGERTVFNKGNILYSKLRPYLLKVLEVDDDGICTPELVPFTMYGNIDNQYIIGFLKSPYVDNEINQLTYGVKMPRVGTETMLNFLVPLPPLSEQKRIVTMVEELMAKIDDLEKTEKELEALKKAFPVDMKAALLQAAMQGKLTEQLPEDGNAKDLLEQIKAEKAKLIKEGKLKKEKPLPDITEDEKAFDIPENWEWCHIGDLFLHASGKQQSSSDKSGGTPRKFITTSNLYWGYFVLDNVKVMNFTDTEMVSCSATKGDLLVCEGGAGYGRSAVWDKEYDICLQNHIHRLRPVISGVCEYVYYCMYFLKENNRLAPVGTAMPGLSANRLKGLVVPLPPLAEQKRIVEKLEKLLPLCDGLK